MKFQNSRSFYKSIFDSMPDGLAYCQMIFDAKGAPIDFIYLLVNNNFYELTGLKKVVGKKVTELIPGIRVDNPEVFDIYGRVSLSQEPEQFEIYVKGLAKWEVVSVYSPQKGYFVAIFKDVSEQKLIKKNLEDTNIAAMNVLEDLNAEKSKVEVSRAKEKAILLSIGDGLIATDEKGSIIIINETAEMLLMEKSGEVVGKNFFEVINMENEKGTAIPFDDNPISKALATSTITTTAAGLTYYYVRKDKTKFPVSVTVAPVVFEDKIIGAIEVFRDITEEKEIDKAKTEFVSLASHQLRTPLTAISWYTEMILSGDVGNVTFEQKKYLEEIYQGNHRMIALVNTLLDVSRLELGTLMVETKPTDVVTLARSVLDEQKQKIEEKKLIVVDDFSKDIPLFSTDANLLRMVFQNLLSNSINYSPREGRIDFSISLKDNNTIFIKVSDTGYGIPKNQQDKIFTKLFRADNARERDTNGTGLGLYIVKSVVENAGGKIWFESEEKKGSTFYITLPLLGAKKKENSP